ncbi:MAG: MOSC domain-containing protein [Actinobacteria bacterium]|nr:MAG: MOSC domain-containing protein [Actinomycetota bacterium]
MVVHRTMAELEAGLGHIAGSPPEEGTLALIVRRPDIDEREMLETGVLHPDHGLVGDSWSRRRSGATVDGSPDPVRQLNVMNARAIALIAVDPERWALAGDQLYVDFDLSEDNAPPGTRIAIGEAVIEVSEPPHSGCRKFSARFGVDALRFVNSEVGRQMHLRGINARVVLPGTIRHGDIVRKVAMSVPPA